MITSELDISKLSDHDLAESIRNMRITMQDLENILCFHRTQRVRDAEEQLSDEAITSKGFTPQDTIAYISHKNSILEVSRMEDRDILRAIQAICPDCTVEDKCCGLHRGQ